MFENLSKEVLEKVKQAKSKEEALTILKENGITLTDEDLAGVAGGDSDTCFTYNMCLEDKNCPILCLIFTPVCDIICPSIDHCPKNSFSDA